MRYALSHILAIEPGRADSPGTAKRLSLRLSFSC